MLPGSGQAINPQLCASAAFRAPLKPTRISVTRCFLFLTTWTFDKFTSGDDVGVGVGWASVSVSVSVSVWASVSVSVSVSVWASVSVSAWTSPNSREYDMERAERPRGCCRRLAECGDDLPLPR